MNDEELFRRIQARKNRGPNKGIELVGGQDYRKEALQLLHQIAVSDNWDDEERQFIQDMHDRLHYSSYQPAQSQVFWLRDLRDRCLDD